MSNDYINTENEFESKIKVLKDITSFEGKRNCALTLIISENCNCNKIINQIEKQINTIKHENKKRQLRLVINKLKKETKKYIQENRSKGLIICCGLSNDNETVQYYEINAVKSIIESYEYFYDYKFNINKIYEKMFESIEFKNISKKEIDKLREKELILFKKEIDESVYDSLSYIIYISTDFINLDLCIDSINHNFKIMVIEENIPELKTNYGDMVGVLYYRMNPKKDIIQQS